MSQTDTRPEFPDDASRAAAAELEELGAPWLPLPDVAEALGLDVGRVRRLVQDTELLAARVGERRILCVPSALVLDGATLPELKGTVSVLRDAGYSDEEALRWLFTPDESLPGRPVDALRAGSHTEIRRRAQALAF